MNEDKKKQVIENNMIVRPIKNNKGWTLNFLPYPVRINKLLKKINL